MTAPNRYGAPPTHTDPPPAVGAAWAPGRRQGPRGAIVATAVVAALVVGGAVGWLIGQHGDSVSSSGSPAPGSGRASASIAAPHGPTKLIDGVPVGYTHDKGGASTAAVNAVQAALLVGNQRLSADVVVQHLAVSGLDADSKSAMTQPYLQTPGTTPGSIVAMPLTSQIVMTSADEATVTVYGAEYQSGSLDANSSAAGGLTYFLDPVQVRWVDGDWKVSKFATAVGPPPGGLSTIDEPGTQKFEPWAGGQFLFYTGG